MEKKQLVAKVFREPEWYTQKGKDVRTEIMKHVNALLNEGAGIICLHVEDAHMLGDFDQKVNPFMRQLIPDDTLFHENFERHALDKNHVVFTIINRERPLSLFSFDTKISLDKGVEEPTHGQLRRLLQQHTFPGAQAQESIAIKFLYKQEVQLTRNGENSVFQESSSIQAKAYDSPSASNLFDEKNKPGLFLPKYITALSKLPNGGSVYLGVIEDQQEALRWIEVKEPKRGQLVTIVNRDYGLWEDEKGGYHLATTTQVPVDGKKSKQTGVFKCMGVELPTKRKQKEFKEEILKQAAAMYCHPAPGSASQAAGPNLDVEFHNVDGQPSRFVVEIRVSHYEGVAFMHKEGPQAFCMSNTQGDIEIEPMDVQDVLQKLSA